jgi:hypothetical protein
VAGLGVAHDIGDRLADDERQDGFGGRGQLGRIVAAFQDDAGGVKSFVGVNDLRCQAFAAISADRFAHVGEGLARNRLDFADFAFGTLGIPIHQLASQF